MPRSTTVLTALVAFGAGAAVGANWKQLRKHVGPLVEKMGLKLADLGDILSAAGVEEFAEAPAASRKTKTASRAKAKTARKEKSIFDDAKSYRNGHSNGAGPVKVAAKRRSVRSKTPKATSLAATLAEAVLQN